MAMSAEKKKKIFVLLSAVGIVLWMLTFIPNNRDRKRNESRTSRVERARHNREESRKNSKTEKTRKGTAAAKGSKGLAAIKGKEVIFRAEWGNGPDQVGRKNPSEGAPEGPMSFIVAGNGRIFLLDQVNRRILEVHDGKITKSIPIPSDTFQDIDVLPGSDSVAVMDRLAAKKVDVMDLDGKILSTLPLQGGAVKEGGGVTALFARKDGMFVEYDHKLLVRIAGPQGTPDTDRPTVLGRLSLDGSFTMLARIEHPMGILVQVKSRKTGEETVIPVSFSDRVRYILELASDSRARIYAAVRLVSAGEDPSRIIERDEVVALRKDIGEVSRLAMPGPEPGVDEEQFRSIRIGPDGSVYQLLFSDTGVTLTRWSMP